MNAAETKIAERFIAEGWTVLRHGWPDLLCVKGDSILAVEVKAPLDKLSLRQQEMHRALGLAGLAVKVEYCESQLIRLGLRALATKEGVTA